MIGLKVQVISNDPQNRYIVDAPDIQRLLALYRDKIDMDSSRSISNYLTRSHCWMSGSAILSEEEKRDMLQDAKDVQRGKVFMAARTKSQEGTLDEYIDFYLNISNSLNLCPPSVLQPNLCYSPNGEKVINLL